MDPVHSVQAFIDAVNARDVDRVVGCFHADAVLQDDAVHVVAEGEQALRQHFGWFIAQSPDLHVEIPARIHVGSWVVEVEHTTGLVLEEPVPDFNIISAYRVEDGKIVKCMGLQ
ncbi:MAG: hypothetical protein NVS2B16_34270 [Chloroflexota bacterium]